MITSNLVFVDIEFESLVLLIDYYCIRFPLKPKLSNICQSSLNWFPFMSYYSNIDIEVMKNKSAELCLKYINKNDFHIGIGTGSTVECLIPLFKEMIVQNNKVIFYSSSSRTSKFLSDYKIPFKESIFKKIIDVYIDGADAIDSSNNLVKGGGGALFREKIMLFNSNKRIIIADCTKRVSSLWNFYLPIEISSFAYNLTLSKIESLLNKNSLNSSKYFNLSIRREKSGDFFISDNGNYIADLKVDKKNLFEKNIETIANDIKNITGVIEHGFCSCELIDVLIVSFLNKSVVSYCK